MRYVQARMEQNYRDLAYRIYMSDAIKGLSGTEIRYAELIDNRPVDEKNPEEIKQNIKDHLRKIRESS